VLLLGDPVGHSLSADFQNAAFQAAGLQVVYEARRVEPANLPRAIAAMRKDPRVLGANVTIPHKQAVVELLDGLGPEAQALKAVNTISRRAGTLIGWNTDGSGFSRALEQAPYDPAGKEILILGAGGAARAVADVLRSSAAKVWVSSRKLSQARGLCKDLDIKAGGPAPFGSLSMVVRKADLIVNATPVGLDGTSLIFPTEWLVPNQFVFDLIYNPPLTPLLRGARERGAKALNGLSMLLYQGMASFEIWTGQQAPEDAMRAALQRALLEQLG
jgi:shikimate dehydrogenase